MPALIDTALAQALYWSPGPTLDGVKQPGITYGREYYQRINFEPFNTRKDWLTGFGLDNNAQVLVVGCGFGYLLEYLLDAGIPDVWGIEGGSFFWDVANDAEWRVDVKPRVANDWIGSGTEQASLDALVGVPNNERFGWIIDEDAAPAHSDAELPAFIAGLEARLQGNAKGRIVHLVTPTQGGGQDSSQNWKTLAEWKAVAPDHTWVDRIEGTVG
jgi:hypothetical protein